MNYEIQENLNYIKSKLDKLSNIYDNLYNEYYDIMRTFSDVIGKLFIKLNSNRQNLSNKNRNTQTSTAISSNSKSNNMNLNDNRNNFFDNDQYHQFLLTNNDDYIENNMENDQQNIQLLIYDSIEIIFLIFSYGNIFISDSKKTSKITFEFFYQNINYIIVIYNKEITLALFNKIYFIYKNFDKTIQKSYLPKLKEIFKRLEEILDTYNIEKENIIIYNKYKNIIDSLTLSEKNEDLSLFKSQKNISFVPIINLSQDIKNYFNEPKVLLETLNELDEESKIIKTINEKHQEIMLKGLCEINKQYLYIFKKIMDKIDSISSNENIVQIFSNIILRSSTFIKYIQKSFYINKKYIIPKNKEIFIEKYIKIGQYLYEIYIKPIDGNLLNKFNDCIENQKKKIIQIVDDFCMKEGIKSNNYQIIFSEFHSFIYKIMLSDSEFQKAFSYLAFNIKMGKSEFKHLYDELKIYKIQKLYSNQFIDYIQFQSKDVEDRETGYILENDKGYVEICELLGKILFNDPININLFIVIKIWAINYEISMDSNKENELKLFDDSLILYFMYLFLIQIGEIKLFNEYVKVDNDNLIFKENLNNLKDYKEKDLLYMNKNDSKLKKIGKFFIDFLYFIFQLITTSQNLLKERKKFLKVSLNSFSFTSFPIEINNKNEESYIQLRLLDMRNNKKYIHQYTNFDLKHLKYIVTKTLHNLLDDNKIKQIFSFENIEYYNDKLF